MAGRPGLAVGTYGTIRTCQRGKLWRAMTKYRDADGVVRAVERTAKTEAAAVRNLKEALRDRVTPTGGRVTADSRFQEAAELWHSSVLEAVAQGRRSPTTADQYRGHLDRSVLPQLGQLRLRELTTSRVDAFLRETQRARGTATARSCRAVLSGVLAFAVREDALSRNTARGAGPLEATRRRKPRSLTPKQALEWLARLDADRLAVRRDVPDLTEFLLATGVRIGEVLGTFWSDLDPEARTVAIDHTVVRVKGKGLIRKSTKSEAGERTLPLPSWAMVMLNERRKEVPEDEDGPIFSDGLGGLRDPSNTSRAFREARDTAGFSWVTPHVFRKTAATIMDDAGLSARHIANHLGHARPSLTQDVYLGRKAVDRLGADALEAALGGLTNIVRRRYGDDLDEKQG